MTAPSRIETPLPRLMRRWVIKCALFAAAWFAVGRAGAGLLAQVDDLGAAYWRAGLGLAPLGFLLWLAVDLVLVRRWRITKVKHHLALTFTEVAVLYWPTLLLGIFLVG